MNCHNLFFALPIATSTINIMKLTHILYILIPALASCSQQPTWHHDTGSIWHTTYSIKYAGEKSMTDSIISVLNTVELAVSPFNSDSEVAQLNSGHDIVLSPMLRAVFDESRRINILSGGAFDPTVAPLVNLWGFGYRKNSAYADSSLCVPHPDSIRAVLNRVGIADCIITPDGRISRKHPLTEFDFSGVAKGFGVDCVGETLRRSGISNFMIEIGGEVLASGLNPEGRDWTIGIAVPDESNIASTAMVTVKLHDRALATSGNYRNYIDLADGQRVSHTISPVTGRSVRSNTLSVTVLAPSCMTADALATSCMVMPLDSAFAMIESQPEVAALFIINDTTATTRRRKSPQMTTITTSRWP